MSDGVGCVGWVRSLDVLDASIEAEEEDGYTDWNSGKKVRRWMWETGQL